jgi:hypothetical protein
MRHRTSTNSVDYDKTKSPWHDHEREIVSLGKAITFCRRRDRTSSFSSYTIEMKVALAVVGLLVGLLSKAEGRVGEERVNELLEEPVGQVTVDEPQDESSTVEADEVEELMDYVIGFKQPDVSSLGSSMTQQEMVHTMSSAFTRLSGPFRVHTLIPRFAFAGVMLSARVSTILYGT